MSRFAVSVMFRPGPGRTHRPAAKGAGRRGLGARAGVPRFAQQRPGTAPAAVKPVRTGGRIARRPDVPTGQPGVTTRPSRASAPRRLGSAAPQEAVPLLRPAGRVSRPGDVWELEAERLARVVSAPGSSATSPASGHVRPAPPVVPPRLASVPEPVPAWADPGAARPLAPSLRRQLEAATGADLRAVRVHRGPAAERAAASVRARAFVQGSHIFLGRDQRVDDASVVAHEAAHTIQQSAALNAAHAHGPPAAGPGIQLTRAPPGMVQRIPILSDVGEAIVDVGEAVYEAGSTAVGVAGDLITGDFWGAVRRLAPSVADILEEIADKGLWEFLKEKIGGVVDMLFGGLRQVGDFFGSLGDWVAGMLGTIREVLAGLVGRGKEALFGALRNLRAFLGEVAGEVWDRLAGFFRPIGDFFSRVANFFTGAVLPFLEELGGEVWSTIKRWAGRLWDALEPVRDVISSAWDFVLDLLGLGGGGGGGGGEGGGILGWIQDKAGEVWDWIKGLTAPVVGGIRTVLRWLGNLAPLEAIRTLRERMLGWVNRATQMADRLEEPDGVAEHREVLRDVILPGILGAIQALRGGISAAGHWVQGTVGGLAESVAGFFDALAGNEYLAFASGALEWLRDGARQLGAWASEGIGGLFGLVDDALATLARWVEPVLNLVRQLIATLFNLLARLPDLVLGPLWRLIPAWIREPVKNFLINQVLRRIPLFRQLLDIPNLVDRALAVARRVLLQVFLDGDLLGAAWTFFRAVLEFFGLPPPLVVNLIRNAARALGDIVRAPVSFFINLLRAVRDGFLNFLDNFGRHLLDGLADWLFGTLGEAGIRVPREFSLRAVFDVVLQILRLTVDHVFELIAQRLGPERTALLRRGLGVAQEAARYVQILVTGGPAALWDEIRGQLSGLWDRIVEGVTGFLMERLVATATRWVLSLLDITGIMPVINSLIAIYRAIESFFRYLRQLLEIVNSVLEGLGEIARGVIARGAALVERNLARLLPIAIGFLANQLGLGGLAGHIRRILERLREMVDRALGWLIDRIVAGVQAVAGAVRGGVAAAREAGGRLLDWLGARQPFRGPAGESHDILVEGGQGTAQLMVQSERQTLEQAITTVEGKEGTPAADKVAVRRWGNQALTALNWLKDPARNVAPGERALRPGGASVQTDQDPDVRLRNRELREALRELGPLFERHLFGEGPLPVPEIPPSPVNADGFPLSASVKRLSANRRLGGTPSSSHPRWLAIAETGLTRSEGEWVNMHVIPDDFQGPGDDSNLVPGMKLQNNTMRRGLEEPIERLIGEPGNASKRGVVWLRAEVSYHPDSARSAWPEKVRQTGARARYYGRQIDFTWGLHQRDESGAWPEQPALATFRVGPIPLPPFPNTEAARAILLRHFGAESA